MAVLVQDIVLDIHPAQGLPQDDSTGAVPRNHVVVNFHVAHRGVARNLQAGGDVAHQDVVQHRLVGPAQIQPVIQIAARPPVVVNVVGQIDIIASALIGIDPVPAIGAAAGGIAVVMDFVVEDLIAIAMNGDPPVGSAPDFKSINHIVTAVQIDAFIAIRRVLAIDHRPALDFRSQHDGTGRAPAGAQMQPPAAAVIVIHSGQDVDRDARPRHSVGPGDRPERLPRGSGIRIAALRGYVEIGPLCADERQAQRQ